MVSNKHGKMMWQVANNIEDNVNVKLLIGW